MLSKTGRFFVISAPSGAGKTTLVKRLISAMPDLVESISATTRKLREGEENGRDYHFISEEEFRRMVNDREFFEWEEVHGSLYGTPKAQLLANRNKGQDTLLDIDVRGALNLKKSYPNSCLIFLAPPSLEVLEERLKSRKTEGDDSLRRRLEGAKKELAQKDRFDYVVVNADLEKAVYELKEIINRERDRS